MRLPTPALLLLLTAAVAVLLGLGTWQVQRHGWKEGLVEERTARTAAPPLAAADAQRRAEHPGDLAWYRVRLTGAWDTEHIMVLANRVRYGIRGQEAVVPLRLDDGTAVLVHRGWFPESERDTVLAALRAERRGDVTGLVIEAGEVTGRRTEAGTWTRLAPASMGADIGVSVAPWYVIEGVEVADASRAPSDGVLPVRTFTGFTNTTPHLQYAATWYGIALALVGVAVARFVVAPRRRRRATDASRVAGD